MWYKVRIHECNDTVTRDRVREFFGRFDGAVFIVYETEANRSHYQGIVWWSGTEDALRKRIRPFFNVTGNDQYSVGKVNNYEAHTRYLCKGPDKKRGNPPDVVCMCAIDIDVGKKHEEFWDENDALRKKVKKEPGGKTQVEEVLQRVKAMDWKGYTAMAKRREVAQQVVNVMTERNTGVNMFQARGLFNAVMLRIDGEFRDGFVEELISKY